MGMALLTAIAMTLTIGLAADGTSIAALVHARLALMKDVAAYKYLNGIPVEDLDREAIVLVHATEQAYDAGLNGETMAPFFKTQIDAAKAIQRCWIDRWKNRHRDGTR